MKKLISVILAMIMVFSLFVPAANVSAADEEHPTIVVSGSNTQHLYSADGESIFPLDDSLSLGNKLVGIITPLLEQLALGIVLDDYSEVGKLVYDAIVPSIGSYATDKNGEASDGSSTEFTAYTQDIPVKTSSYDNTDYRMCYDWRISPLVMAEQLRDYIDLVLEATDDDKVNLMGRCYGANVIAAYLELYEEHALKYVDDIAYASPSLDGIDFVAALFTGNLYFEDVAVNNFVDYFFNRMDIIEDETTREVVLSLLDLLEKAKALGITMDMLNTLVEKIKYDVLPAVLRDSYARMPSYWSLVPADRLDEAIEFVFGGYEDEYAELIKKIRAYNEIVQLNVQQTILDLDERGLDFYVIAKYNLADFPLYKGAHAQADAYILTYRQAFGGYYADCGEVFSEAYIRANKDNKYISPDYKIDASTCLLPEMTWFVKNLNHDVFPDVLDDLIIALMDGEMTVSSGEIPQFLTFVDDDDTIVPTEGTDEDYVEKSFVDVIVRFFRALFNLLKNLISENLFPDKE